MQEGCGEWAVGCIGSEEDEDAAAVVRETVNEREA
jgi:hypothetical protein